jgi:hypothetical protein
MINVTFFKRSSKVSEVPHQQLRSGSSTDVV